MRITKMAAGIAAALVLVISLCSCSDDHSTDYTESFIKNAIDIRSVPEFKIEESLSKTYGDGTIEGFAVVSFEPAQAESFEIQTANYWKAAPVNSKYMNFTDYASILPNTELDQARQTLTRIYNDQSYRYTFIDKTDEFQRKYAFNIKEDRAKAGVSGASAASDEQQVGGVIYSTDTDPRTPYYAVGFSCGFYVPSERKLYVYSIEPTYDIKYIKYLIR